NKIYDKFLFLINNSKYIKKALEYGSGIRILKQDLIEIFVGFILSANNNINRITNSMNKLSERFGTIKLDSKGHKSYIFPKWDDLKKLDEDDFKNIGAGYRSLYLYNFIQNFDQNELWEIKNLDIDKLYNFLIKIKGIGPKIADCILLFGYSKTRVFPVDTWIKKYFYNVEQKCYKKVNDKFIRKYLVDKYGNLSGYIQQYIFYYIRKN
ncbi:MAG: DNA-3-methyladenine glycosylase family protein, partial [Candidatus Woesearchaeota archaeon]